MACGCGGSCCGSQTTILGQGLGFLPADTSGGTFDFWGWLWGDGGGADSPIDPGGGGGGGGYYGCDYEDDCGRCEDDLDYGEPCDYTSDPPIVTIVTNEPGPTSPIVPFTFPPIILPAPLPAPTGGSGPPGTLIGYCAPGYYHPISDPTSCVPFPPSQPGTQAPAPGQPPQAPAAPRAPSAPRVICQPGYVLKAGRCVRPTQGSCPAGYALNSANHCVKIPAQQGVAGSSSGFPWWILLAVVAVVGISGSKKR
jgi:hypothetical protein